MKKLNVKIKNSEYLITIDKNIFKKIADYHFKNYQESKALIVTDSNVSKLYLAELEKYFSSKNIKCFRFIIKPGESSKSFNTLSQLSRNMITKGVRRQDIIYALGGGIVGDLSGFLASIILRGIKFIQIPTTLLSQVDSSVGGKTGINTPEGKNLIGTFYQPACVFIDPLTLSSLPKKDFLSGYAEVLKYALINDREFFDWLNKNKRKILNLHYQTISKIIFLCCRKKSEIVTKDEKESGIRMLLNFGHTFAHAIESELKYKVLHGEAVAVGMLMAMRLSYRLGKLDIKNYEAVKKHIQDMSLPVNLSDISKEKKWSAEKMLNKMKNDKKVKKNSIRFILCNKIGHTYIATGIKKNYILMSINDFI